MRVRSVSYRELRGAGHEWKLEGFSLGNINLLVGKNATGKTRVLNIITSVAHLVTGKLKPFYLPCEFTLDFVDGVDKYRYVLNTKEEKVEKEEFLKNDSALLTRSATGPGRIFSEAQNLFIDFEPPPDAIAVAVRRDKIQHPFIEPLTQWASHLHHFSFGSSLGKETVGLFMEGGPPVDPFNPQQLVGIFRDGLKKHGTRYTDAILADMKRLDYEIEGVSLDRPSTMTFNFDPPGATKPDVRWLKVKEKGIPESLDQLEISQGMFRALSLIAQVNFSAMELRPECILVDDIGEGLDFHRSCALIKLLTEKASATNIQLVMSTNDRFVMNSIPLEMWTVLRREGGMVRAHNYENSKKIFDEFSLTGLNNFDFLATDFLATGGLGT